MIDRGDAVNLARNALDDEHLMGLVSRPGIRKLCEAVLAMDAELARLYALRPEAEATIECLIDVLRPFAQQADTMQTLKDGDRIAGVYVANFRDAAKAVNRHDAPQPSSHPSSERKRV